MEGEDVEKSGLDWRKGREGGWREGDERQRTRERGEGERERPRVTVKENRMKEGGERRVKKKTLRGSYE